MIMAPKVFQITVVLFYVLYSSYAQQVKLAQSFSMGMETSFPGGRKIYNRKVALDASRQLVRLGLSYPLPNNDLSELIVESEIDVLDVSKGIMYRENRTVAKCKALSFNSEAYKQYYDFWEKVLEDLYQLGAPGSNHKRINSTKIRGKVVDVDLFQGQRKYTDIAGLPTTMTTYWYLLDNSWTDIGSGENKEGHRRIMMLKLNVKNVNINLNVVVNYFNWAFRKPYLKEYTVRRCYPDNLKKIIEISFVRDVGSGDLKTVTLPEIDRMVEQTTKSIGISLLRLTDISVVKRGGGGVTFRGTLLGHVTQIPGMVSPDDTIKPGLSLQDAFNRLVSRAQNGGIKVQNIGGANIKSTGFQAVDTTPQKGYSPGAMAGLAFGMIILGALLGLLTIGLVYAVKTKKSPMGFLKHEDETVQ